MAKREHYTEHPSIAVINGTPHLRVFEDFFIEKELPKWRKIKKDIDKNNSGSGETSASYFNSGSITDSRSQKRLLDGSDMDRRHYVSAPGDRRSMREATSKKPTLWSRLAGWFRKRREPDGEPAIKVFEEMKNSMLVPTTKDMIYARKALDAASARLRATGQYEIAQKVENARPVIDAEIALLKNGRLKYVSEEQCVKFMLESERGIRVEYLRYWPEILPTDVAKEKLKADAMCVFDNYVVMYFDPSTEKFSLIKEAEDDAARAARRDPILFGVIHGSRKLYYVTDWVTDDDDLTLEALEKVLGEKAFDISDDSFGDTSLTIARVLDDIVVNVEQEVQNAEMNGTLLTDEMLELGYLPEAKAEAKDDKDDNEK